MNKSAIVARVAARLGLNKFTAEGAVDTVFETIAEGLAEEGGCGSRGSVRSGREAARPAWEGIRAPARACRYRPRIAVVQGVETAEGGGEAGLAGGANGAGR